MHLRAEDADRGHHPVAPDDGLEWHHPGEAGFAHRSRIHGSNVKHFLRWLDVAADANPLRVGARASLRLGRRQATSANSDRLPEVANLQGDRAIPVARIAQLEV